jgi:hypothetical protein
VREYRPPEEVFHADSLATLPDAPLTVGHPGLVSPDNYQDHAVGHIREVKQDGERIAADVVIQGRRAIKAIESGMRQVSCGYSCRLDETPGFTQDGQAYDRVQRDIRYNHVALVAAGRAGSDIRLRLDGAGEQILEERTTMKTERIDDVDYEVGSDFHKAALRHRADAEKATVREQEFKKLADEFAGLKARLDAAELDKGKLEASLKEATDPKRLDALVQDRLAITEIARRVLGADVKLDGLDAPAIKRQIAQKAYPSLKFDGQPEAYIEGLFTAATADAEKAGEKRADELDKHRKVRTDGANNTPAGDVMLEAREHQLTSSRDAWKMPLAHSKES